MSQFFVERTGTSKMLTVIVASTNAREATAHFQPVHKRRPDQEISPDRVFLVAGAGFEPATFGL